MKPDAVASQMNDMHHPRQMQHITLERLLKLYLHLRKYEVDLGFEKVGSSSTADSVADGNQQTTGLLTLNFKKRCLTCPKLSIDNQKSFFSGVPEKKLIVNYTE